MEDTVKSTHAMADGLTFTGLRDAYAAASPARKLVWGVLILLLLALPAALIWRESQATRAYSVLFAGLSDRDGGEVVQALEKLNIPYRLAETDGSVQVPAEQLHVARYKLAAQGLPRGDKPAEETAGPRFGVSPFQEQLGYQHALEASLAHSVQSIDAVESARVHLALPKQSAFLREQVPPAASVVVKFRHGMAPNEESIEALRQIVAGAVPGLSPGRVSVIDQGGALLAEGLAGFYRGLSPSQLESARRLESDLASRIRRVLTPVLGNAAFRVQVTARMGFDERPASRTALLAGSIEKLSILVVVDDSTGADHADPDRLAALARQAIDFDGARGDSLQVIRLPFAAQPAAAAPAARQPNKIPLAAQPQPVPAQFLGNDLLPVYAGLALAVLFVLLLILVRARQRRRGQEKAALAAHAPQPGELFEARLDNLRQRVMADPRVAASVVKLWMQQT